MDKYTRQALTDIADISLDIADYIWQNQSKETIARALADLSEKIGRIIEYEDNHNINK